MPVSARTLQASGGVTATLTSPATPTLAAAFVRSLLPALQGRQTEHDGGGHPRHRGAEERESQRLGGRVRPFADERPPLRGDGHPHRIERDVEAGHRKSRVEHRVEQVSARRVEVQRTPQHHQPDLAALLRLVEQRLDGRRLRRQQVPVDVAGLHLRLGALKRDAHERARLLQRLQLHPDGEPQQELSLLGRGGAHRRARDVDPGLLAGDRGRVGRDGGKSATQSHRVVAVAVQRGLLPARLGAPSLGDRALPRQRAARQGIDRDRRGEEVDVRLSRVIDLLRLHHRGA